MASPASRLPLKRPTPPSPALLAPSPSAPVVVCAKDGSLPSTSKTPSPVPPPSMQLNGANVDASGGGPATSTGNYNNQYLMVKTCRCEQCPMRPSFKTVHAFCEHLRAFHSMNEGSSFICRYGPNNICASLPLEGVSDPDYKAHVMKKHVKADEGNQEATPSSLQQRTNSLADSWSVFDCTQNLPAVLNDPRKPRRETTAFFTRHWGESFVDPGKVSPSPHLPEVDLNMFHVYYHAHGKRVRRHARELRKIRARESQRSTPVLEKDTESQWRAVLSEVPDLFTDPRFDLAHPATFRRLFLDPTPLTPRKPLHSAVDSVKGGIFLNNNDSFPDFAKIGMDGLQPDAISLSSDTDGDISVRLEPAPGETAFTPCGNKALEAMLSHYLDNVEVQIAKQISSQSEAFFNAMTSHEELQEYLQRTKVAVQYLRSRVHDLDSSVVENSLKVLSLDRKRKHGRGVLEKLQMMATVKETQPTVQMLLNSYDFLGALDLIATTQDVLQQELAGVTSFRHLSHQLVEVEKMISHMLQDEYVHHVKEDLSPESMKTFVDDGALADENKLISLLTGMIKLREYRFVDVLKEEVVLAVKALLRDTIRSELSPSSGPGSGSAGGGDNNGSVDEEDGSEGGEGAAPSASLAEQMRSLGFPEWMTLVRSVFKNLSNLCRKVKIFQDTFQELVEVIGNQRNPHLESLKSPLIAPMEYDVAMSETDEVALLEEINGIVFHAATFTHDRCARVIVARSKDGFMERLSPEEFLTLSESVESFVQESEVLTERKMPALRGCLQAQSVKFVNRLHKEKKDKLGTGESYRLILDSEYWKQADVPVRFQRMVDEIHRTGKLRSQPKATGREPPQPSQYLYVGTDRYAVVGTALLFLEILVEYCQCAEALPSVAPELVTRVVEILKSFNSRVCQLILGAGAVQLVGLRTISTRNLALASRCLQLVAHFVPAFQDHFESLLTVRHKHLTKHFDKVGEDYENHVKEIFAKLLSIMEHHLSTALSKWEMEPPSPTPAFQTACKHIRKLYENVCDILPNSQLQKLFLRIHDCFKKQLYLVLKANDVTPHGSPAYSFVCSEFSYYMESIRSLPCCASVSETLSDIFAENI